MTCTAGRRHTFFTQYWGARQNPTKIGWSEYKFRSYFLFLTSAESALGVADPRVVAACFGKK